MVTTDDAAPELIAPVLAPGAVVADRYRIEARLGAGGNGTVFRCTDQHLGLTVALSEQYKFAQRETKFLGLGDTSTVRLARLLLEWSAEHGVPGGGAVHIPLHVTHGDLAQAIGSTRETVTRVLGQLSRAGVVERRDNAIFVLHPAELAGIAMPAHHQP